MKTASRESASYLKRDPFSAEPDSRFYFAYESVEQRLALLNRLLEGTDALILVLGEPGSGKTMLLKRFLDAVASPWRSGRIRSHSNGSTKLETLENHPAFIVKDARDPIILLDDAHELSRIDLGYLLKEALGPGSSAKIKRLVLFAEPEFMVSLAAMSDDLMGKVAVNKIFMPPMGLEESGNYLRHRLRVAGYTGKDPFGSKALKKLHRLSGGIPGRLNEAAASWLEKSGSASPAGKGSLRRFVTLKWLAGAVAIGCLLVLAFVLFQNMAPAPTSRKSGGIKDRSLIRAKIPSRKPPLPSPSQTSPPRPAGEVVSSAVPAIQAPAIKAPPPPPAIIPNEADASGARSMIRLPEADQKQSALQSAPTEKPGDPGGGMQREAWLLAQNPEHYTIQVMGVRSETALQRFVAQNPGLKTYTLAYYRTTYRSEQWYPLLCGVYASPDEARAAIQKLPDNLRKMSPWIRKLAPIQGAIRKQNR